MRLDFNAILSTPQEQERLSGAATNCRRITDANLWRTAGTRMSDFWHCWILADSVFRNTALSFTGSRQQMQACADRGLYIIGITGWVCDERRGLELRELYRLFQRGATDRNRRVSNLLPRDLRRKPPPTQRARVSASHPNALRHGVVKIRTVSGDALRCQRQNLI